jgi:hypothetical protein
MELTIFFGSSIGIVKREGERIHECTKKNERKRKEFGRHSYLNLQCEAATYQNPDTEQLTASPRYYLGTKSTNNHHHHTPRSSFPELDRCSKNSDATFWLYLQYVSFPCQSSRSKGVFSRKDEAILRA